MGAEGSVAITAWTDRPVLVTGAGGFIGSHLVESLATRGARVTAFVRYNSRDHLGWLENLPPDLAGRVTIVAGDLRDPSAVREAARDAEYVFHLGALISIPYSYRHPQEVVETNVLGTVNILEAAREARTKRVIHTSTSEVYGTARTARINEGHPLQGQSPYSASKIAADKIAESYWRAFDVPVVTVRPFNTYGPRQSARAVIPTIITQALVCEEVKLGSLMPTRDFTFVSDTVSGFMRAAEAAEAVAREINLGSGEEVSIGDLAKKIIALVGRPVRIVCEEQRLRPPRSEVDRLHSDNSLASRLLGWKPTVSLEEGLRATIAWVEGHLSSFDVGTYKI